jgi:HSP20 family molecular chaperone IbpA
LVQSLTKLTACQQSQHQQSAMMFKTTILDNRSLKINCESELQFGVRKFSNNFKVRPGTTEEHVSASYEDGVLRVQVQKVDPSAGATQIPVA